MKNRNEIDEQYKWNLSPLYSSFEEWEKEFNVIDGFLSEVNAKKGTLADSPECMKQAFEAFDKLHRQIEKLYVYAHLRSDEDISDSERMAYMGRISAKFAEISGATAWFEPEILAMPDELLQKFICSPELSFYKRSLEELLRDKPHTLSEKEETLLGMASDALSTPEKVFSTLSNADMRFPEIEDENGEKKELTHGNYSTFLESENREVRRNAFNAMYDTFGKFRNTMSATLSGLVKTNAFRAKARKFSSGIEAALYPDNVPVDVYENLIASVNANLTPFYEYIDVRKKRLGLDDINMYDLHCPIVSGCNREFSWSESVEKVLASLEPLGEEYVRNARQGLDSRWVDVFETRGKRSGAYSSGCYDSPPYILMNFNGRLNDVFTLAHELGHSMHSLMSRTHQEYHYADYRIFVAEVASTANELLLHHYLMNDTDDANLKLYLLSYLADAIRGTVYRQTMFAEFEKLIYDNFESGAPLTADSLTESYYELNKKYHGPGVNPDEKIGLEWARIPHFYYNFYVYKYATGFSAAAVLTKGILEDDSSKVDAYLNFLKAGSTKDVLDIMLDAGVDLKSPEPVEATLDLFGKTVKELGSEA